MGRIATTPKHHACVWYVDYFDSADGLHAHIRSKHHFECSICHDVSPTAEELEEHGKKWWTPA